MLMKLVSERATDAAPINIGCSEETTISDLVGELTTIAGYQGEIIFDPSKPEGPPRKGLDLSRQYRLIADFRPEFSLREGLRQTFDAARDICAPVVAFAG
jgi:GDP-L-fucose synthase